MQEKVNNSNPSTKSNTQLVCDASTGKSKTLWIGDFEQWMDESTLSSIISELGYKVQGIKLVRDKQNQNLTKYGFIEFESKEFALGFFQSYNGKPIPNYVHKYSLFIL